jgi:hypothetical protein
METSSEVKLLTNLSHFENGYKRKNPRFYIVDLKTQRDTLSVDRYLIIPFDPFSGDRTILTLILADSNPFFDLFFSISFVEKNLFNSFG